MMSVAFRRSALFAAAAGALTLAGCGSSDTIEAENESAESVAEKVAKSDIKPKPGKWESTMTIKKVEIPGLPPEMQEMMKAQLGKAETDISCLTQEEIDANDGEMFKPGEQSGCTYNTFKMGGGEIAADMTCAEGGMEQNMKMSGSYGEEAYAMDIEAEGTVQGQAMSMAMSISSKRLGDCDGSEKG